MKALVGSWTKYKMLRIKLGMSNQLASMAWDWIFRKWFLTSADNFSNSTKPSRLAIITSIGVAKTNIKDKWNRIEWYQNKN